ncbi:MULTISPECIES: hypothetical protein [Tenacibaculum]|uniref:hypothetical protein n=1 Tax=Tenacibaculum TaxID=104267 RepID=UPI001F0A4053|nr:MULTISPECIES: hypothetical protein [Tenacibaculum]MCH3881610.1 hypothetical protein [Tenacibaculum aquimarinum]MDO6598804.1 hypothetical protein [Tenacibaculum sp. 1_MG-2023]
MKIKVATFFLLLFTSLIVAPTIISLVDNTQDITILLNLNEEEENTGKVSLKDIKLKVNSTPSNSFLFNRIQKKKNVRFTTKNYVSEYPKLDTPPPELS